MNLILRKGGKIFLKQWIYNEEIGEGKYKRTFINFKDKNIDDSYLLNLLQFSVELEKGFTIRDWFKLIINYPIYQKLDLFMSSFLNEYHKCPTENCIDPDYNIIRIDFQKIINYNKYKDLKLNEIDMYINVTGRSEKENLDYSLSFWPIKNFLDIPANISNGFITVFNEGEVKQEEGITNFTLYEFINSFIYDISFYGTPDQRNKESKRLKETVKKVLKEQIKTTNYEFGKKIKGSKKK